VERTDQSLQTDKAAGKSRSKPTFVDDAHADAYLSSRPGTGGRSAKESAGDRDRERLERTLIPAKREQAVGLDFQQFIPDATITTARNIERDAEIIEGMLDGSDLLCTVLNKKLAELRSIKHHWCKGDARGAILHLISLREPTASPVAADFLRAVSLKSQAFNLESCTMLLPFLCRLLNTKYEDYLMVAVQSIHTLFSIFGTVINETRLLDRDAGSRGPVDLTREERTEKCVACHKSLISIQHQLGRLHDERRLGEAGAMISVLKDALEGYLCS